MIDRDIKFYHLGVNRKGQLTVYELYNKAYSSPFICTSMFIERHKVSKLLIGCFAGESSFDVVVIDKTSPHADVGIGAFGQTIFTQKLLKRVTMGSIT